MRQFVARASLKQALAGALLVALVLTGAGLLVAAGHITGGASAGNRALTDSADTTKVIGDVSDALQRVFSYAPGSTQATEQDAKDVLGGKASGQYEALFTQVRQQVTAQQVSLSTRVVRAGVTRLHGDTAQVLVFLDQVTRRGAKSGGTDAAAELSVTARLGGGHWRIVDITSR